MSAIATALQAQSRDVPIGKHSALIVIDMQNAFVHDEGSVWSKVHRSEYIQSVLNTTVQNIAHLLASARAAGIEVIYTVVESLTADGRERSLDYKVSGLNIPRKSWGAKVVQQLQPGDDEIVLPKGSCSVFQSTNLAYLLRNLDVKQVVITGGLTDQCIDSAVRDACDLGFLVTTVTDAVYTHTAARHQSSLSNGQGFSRQVQTAQLLAEFRTVSSKKMIPQPSPSNSLQENAKEKHVGRNSSENLREYIRFAITDIVGKELSKTVPIRHRNSPVFMYSGALAFGSNAEVMVIPAAIDAAGCPNAQLIPDWATKQNLPWAARSCGKLHDEVRVRRVICEQLFVGGGLKHCPRAVCRKLLDELAQHEGRGLQILSASELEFCLAKAGSRKPLFNGKEIFSTLQNAKTADFQYALEQGMDSVGVDVRTMNPEAGEGQLEITFSPRFGIQSPDNTATFRTGVKEIAQMQDLCATFSTKPFGLSGTGSGGHFNFSLWGPVNLDDDDANSSGGLGPVTQELGEGGPALSQTARNFLAGILEHVPALEAFCSPTPGCYARHGNWAPTVADWGIDDRFAAVRVKLGEVAKDAYMEFRAPSSAANAYLVLGSLVAAGLDGLERKLSLPAQRREDAKRAQPLPTSLPEALDCLLKDEYLVGRIGKELVSWFVDIKRSELARLEAWIAADVANGIAEDEARLHAWQNMYFEWI